MNNLYIAILSRFTEDEWIWILEILQWMLSDAESLTINELQEVVEFALQDKRDDFQTFLENQCGSILQLIYDSSRVKIQSMHDMFR